MMPSDTERRLVLNALNEVLNGLPPTPKVSRLTERRGELDKLYTEFAQAPSVRLAPGHRELLEDVIRAVVEELGTDEFYTRTGAEIREATDFIDRLRSSC